MLFNSRQFNLGLLVSIVWERSGPARCTRETLDRINWANYATSFRNSSELK